MAAELCRRGLLATPFAGNVPHFDIIESGQNGGHVAVQVKATNGRTWQFDVRKFLDVRLEEDGKRQLVGARQPEPYPELMCVFVALDKTGQDRFFVLEWKELQDVVAGGYTQYLSKHNYARPKAPDSFHTAIDLSEMEPFEDKWDKVLSRVPAVNR